MFSVISFWLCISRYWKWQAEFGRLHTIRFSVRRSVIEVDLNHLVPPRALSNAVIFDLLDVAVVAMGWLISSRILNETESSHSHDRRSPSSWPVLQTKSRRSLSTCPITELARLLFIGSENENNEGENVSVVLCLCEMKLCKKNFKKQQMLFRALMLFNYTFLQ